jgi:TPR repeat protein
MKKEKPRIKNNGVNRSLKRQPKLKQEVFSSGEKEYQLGLQYYHGLSSVKIDYFKAFQHFKQAAGQDHRLARVYTGICYLQGRGTAVEKELGLQQIQVGLPGLKERVKRGEAEAQNLLGYLYHKGWCVKQDDQKAAHCYQKAAARGNASAMYHLGVCYDQGGRHVKQNINRAFKWYAQARRAGEKRALPAIRALLFPEWWADVLEQVRENYRLNTILDLSDWPLTEAQLIVLFKALRGNTVVTSLKLPGDYTPSDAGWDAIKNLVLRNSHLNHLTLRVGLEDKNLVRDTQVIQPWLALSGNRRLTFERFALNWAYFHLTENDMSRIIKRLSSAAKQSSQSLQFTSVTLKTAQLTPLLAAKWMDKIVSYSHKIIKLDLSGNPIGAASDQNKVMLNDIFDQWRKKHGNTIWRHFIPDPVSTIKTIAAFIAEHPSLQEVDLSHTDLSPEDLRLLGEALSRRRIPLKICRIEKGNPALSIDDIKQFEDSIYQRLHRQTYGNKRDSSVVSVICSSALSPLADDYYRDKREHHLLSQAIHVWLQHEKETDFSKVIRLLENTLLYLTKQEEEKLSLQLQHHHDNLKQQKKLKKAMQENQSRSGRIDSLGEQQGLGLNLAYRRGQAYEQGVKLLHDPQYNEDKLTVVNLMGTEKTLSALKPLLNLLMQQKRGVKTLILDDNKIGSAGSQRQSRDESRARLAPLYDYIKQTPTLERLSLRRSQLMDADIDCLIGWIEEDRISGVRIDIDYNEQLSEEKVAEFYAVVYRQQARIQLQERLPVLSEEEKQKTPRGLDSTHILMPDWQRALKMIDDIGRQRRSEGKTIEQPLDEQSGKEEGQDDLEQKEERDDSSVLESKRSCRVKDQPQLEMNIIPVYGDGHCGYYVLLDIDRLKRAKGKVTEELSLAVQKKRKEVQRVLLAAWNKQEKTSPDLIESGIITRRASMRDYLLPAVKAYFVNHPVINYLKIKRRFMMPTLL